MSTGTLTPAPSFTDISTLSSVATSSTSSRRRFGNGAGGSGMDDSARPHYYPNGNHNDSNSAGTSSPGVAPIAGIVIMIICALAILAWCWVSHKNARALVRSLPKPSSSVSASASTSSRQGGERVQEVEVIVMTNLLDVEQRRQDTAAVESGQRGSNDSMRQETAGSRPQGPNDSMV